MKKILIISYYELKDYLLQIADIFRDEYMWNVVYYPLYMYCYDKYSKLENYEEHFMQFINNEKPDVILWWFTDVQLSLFRNVRINNPSIFMIIYNYNDPMNMISRTFIDKCKFFDLIMTPCQGNMCIYKIHTKAKYIEHVPYCYDKSIYRIPTKEELYEYNYVKIPDIVMCCDSLFIDSKGSFSCFPAVSGLEAQPIKNRYAIKKRILKFIIFLYIF